MTNEALTDDARLALAKEAAQLLFSTDQLIRQNGIYSLAEYRDPALKAARDAQFAQDRIQIDAELARLAEITQLIDKDDPLIQTELKRIWDEHAVN